MDCVMRVIFRQLFFKESVFTAGLKNFIQLELIGKTKMSMHQNENGTLLGLYWIVYDDDWSCFFYK